MEYCVSKSYKNHNWSNIFLIIRLIFRLLMSISPSLSPLQTPLRYLKTLLLPLNMLVVALIAGRVSSPKGFWSEMDEDFGSF